MKIIYHIIKETHFIQFEHNLEMWYAEMRIDQKTGNVEFKYIGDSRGKPLPHNDTLIEINKILMDKINKE